MNIARVNGVELEYQVIGTGEPVLLISPVLADGFAPLVAERQLAERCQLIVYHKRGWVGSTPTPGPVTIAEHAEDARALLDHLGLARAHVAGHSSGAAVALQLALDHPDKVHSLVLLEPSLLSVPSAQEFLAKAGPALEAFASGAREQALAIFMSAASGLPWDQCRALLESRMPGSVAQTIRDAHTFFGVELPGLMQWTFTRAQAATLRQPAVSILGTNTEPLWVEVDDLLRSAMPDVVSGKIDGVGHLLHIQDPPQVAKAIAAFIDRHPMRQVESPNPNQALWEKGDFTRIAASMRESGEAVVESLGVVGGTRALDLGCGDGTTALPLARRGVDVLGVDISRNLVDAGNRRARTEALTNLVFRHGDACNLAGIEDGRFDLVLSMFGAMFAPKPLDVAREMVRVTRRGGRIVMGNWIPGDPTLVAQILRISSSYTPPPPEGFVSPMAWGVEDNVVERFTAAGVRRGNISCVKDTYTFEFAGSPSAFVEEFRRYYGPTMNAFAAAEKSGRAAALEAELTMLFESQNQSSTPATTRIPATFLRVEITV